MKRMRYERWLCTGTFLSASWTQLSYNTYERRMTTMKVKAAFSGFSVNDLAKSKEFYTETLGLKVDNEGVGMRIHLPGGGTVFFYPKDDHQPATFTILNFVVENIDEAVDELKSRGVTF